MPHIRYSQSGRSGKPCWSWISSPWTVTVKSVALSHEGGNSGDSGECGGGAKAGAVSKNDKRERRTFFGCRFGKQSVEYHYAWLAELVDNKLGWVLPNLETRN